MSGGAASPPRAERGTGRRTHAERTAKTRAKIIAAAVESIGEVGFQRATASEIVSRAGVTWGAVQHHFGGKDGILLAVLEDSFDRFTECLGDLPGADASLAERVSRFVDGAWQHFGGPHYHSTFEILLQARAAGGEGEERPGWRSEMFRAWNDVWSRLFADSPLPRRRHVTLQHYTLAVLSGLASLRMLEGSDAARREAELELLKQTLARELSAAG